MDLVERLRDNEGHGPLAIGCQGCFHSVMDEAADKIEQLQREVLDRDKLEYAHRNDIERLRAALDDIANGRLSVTDAMLESREAMMSALANYCQERARTALSP